MFLVRVAFASRPIPNKALPNYLIRAELFTSDDRQIELKRKDLKPL